MIPISVDSHTCAVGRNPHRIVRSVDVEEPDSVTVTVKIANPDTGPQYACLTKPIERIRLGDPIGDRQLLVGGFAPPQPATFDGTHKPFARGG